MFDVVAFTGIEGQDNKRLRVYAVERIGRVVYFLVYMGALWEWVDSRLYKPVADDCECLDIIGIKLASVKALKELAYTRYDGVELINRPDERQAIRVELQHLDRLQQILEDIKKEIAK